MILGRNAGLWVALVQSGLNVAAAALVVATNTPLSPSDAALFAALNALGLAIVAVVANAADPTTAPTFALTTKAPATPGDPPAGSSSGPGTGTTGGGTASPTGALIGGAFVVNAPGGNAGADPNTPPPP